MRHIFAIVILALVFVGCKDAKKAQPTEQNPIEKARTEFKKHEYDKAVVSLDEAVGKHKAEYGLDELCEIAALYVNVSRASVNNSDENMLKAASVYSYAEKKDKEAAKKKISELIPGGVAKLYQVMLSQGADDVFVDEAEIKAKQFLTK